MARFRIEQRHYQNIQQGIGQKQKKNAHQVRTLLQHFEENPIWDYAKKIAICEELGMTVAQIQKWSWDHRQKLGLLSSKMRAKKNLK